MMEPDDGPIMLATSSSSSSLHAAARRANVSTQDTLVVDHGDEFCDMDDDDHHHHAMIGASGNAISRSQSGPHYRTIASSSAPFKEEDHHEDIATTSTAILPCTHLQPHHLWTRNLMSDHRFMLASVRILDGPASVKLLKFFLLTVSGIVSWFAFVRWIDWENDPYLTLADMWVYDSNSIIMDTVVFFVVGRLYKQRGVDHLAWILWAVLANFYSSYITNLAFLQHSFTLYEMHCRWPASLWMFSLLAVILITLLVLAHVQVAVQNGIFVQKLIELVLAFVLLLLPLLSSPYFHLHHWYAGWLIGMHFNFDIWWSRAAMAWCWGCYMNGLAVYGRDPVLTCAYGFYVSLSQGCPYMKCYLQGIHTINNVTNQTVVQAMIAPDWRNCSAESYHTRHE